MDDLDRLFRRVVHNVRAAYPELINQPFEVSQLYQQVVPYRLNRRELGVESVEDYELALMQLLSGARGYLTGDQEMQRALRDELEALNPDLSAYRAFATSHVSLVAEAVRAMDQQPVVQPVALSEPAAVAARATERITASHVGSSSEAPVARAASAPSQTQAPPAMPSKNAPPTPQSLGSKTSDAAGEASGCRYCGGNLPAGKNIVFCPYCGHDLTVQHCPACNTELEIGWRFCITCGRQVN